MNLIYRLFYTVLAMSIVTAALLPVVLLFCFYLRNKEKKYSVWQWRVVLLRSICPVAMTSVFSFVPDVNSAFHKLLDRIGINILNTSGVMHSWREVFQNRIEVSTTYEICSLLWLAGFFVVMAGAFLYQRRLKRMLYSVKELGENIYESGYINTPVQLGIFKRKIYVPKKMSSLELSYIIKRSEYKKYAALRSAAVTVIMSVHWFNPVMWIYYSLMLQDMEEYIDDRTVYKKDGTVCRKYAQAILNFVKDEPNTILSLFTVAERYNTKRARRMMYQKWDSKRQRLAQQLILTALVLAAFLMLPIKLAWDGGKWGSSTGIKKQEEKVLDKNDRVVVASIVSQSPEGLEREVRLERISGTETQKGYIGDFRLVMCDYFADELYSIKIDKIFDKQNEQGFYFTKGMAFCIDDYNGDGSKELVLGQQVKYSADEFKKVSGVTLPKDEEYRTFRYAVIKIGDSDMIVENSDIYLATLDKNVCESANFEKVSGLDNAFYVNIGDKKIYYIWDDSAEKYNRREMTDEELDDYKKGVENGVDTNEVNEHSVKSGSTDMVIVSTKKDSTGSELIKSVILNPRGKSVKYVDTEGYFCDLMWIENGNDNDRERFAELIYNGSKAQTFKIYDVRKNRVLFEQEDGFVNLKRIFKDYGEKNIDFKEDGVVLYSLKGMKEGVINIEFAVGTKDNKAIKGSYSYDLNTSRIVEFTFSRV